jgi:EF hand
VIARKRGEHAQLEWGSIAHRWGHPAGETSMNPLRAVIRIVILASLATPFAAPFAAHALSSPVELSAWDRVVMEASFSKADANDDGQLTRSEAMRVATHFERFDAFDANQDGVLDLEEFAAGFAAGR